MSARSKVPLRTTQACSRRRRLTLPVERFADRRPSQLSRGRSGVRKPDLRRPGRAPRRSCRASRAPTPRTEADTPGKYAREITLVGEAAIERYLRQRLWCRREQRLRLGDTPIDEPLTWRNPGAHFESAREVAGREVAFAGDGTEANPFGKMRFENLDSALELPECQLAFFATPRGDDFGRAGDTECKCATKVCLYEHLTAFDPTSRQSNCADQLENHATGRYRTAEVPGTVDSRPQKTTRA